MEEAIVDWKKKKKESFLGKRKDRVLGEKIEF